jgi:iron complex outermembrane receptor protein
MMFKMKSMPLAIAFVVASGALGASASAFAQTEQTAQTTQRVIVTGSLISRTDAETPTPVQVLTAQDIRKSGKTSVAELLNDLAANGQGTLGTGFSGAFANGASGVSLRGLTVGATLVLVDGHRIAPYPLSDDSQRSFVDVSSIPFDAIDSIEVLKSGASSLYGSDAIAGVVNIKLKKNVNGTRLSAETGNTQHGGGRTHRGSVSTGTGDLAGDGYNAFLTAEWRRQGDIKVGQRSQFEWDNADWRARGGNNINIGVPTAVNSFLTATNTPFLYNPANPNNPAGVRNVDNPANYTFLNPARCDFARYRAGACAVTNDVGFIQPQTTNINLLAGATKALNGDWELAVKGSVFQRKSLNNRGTPYLAYNPTAFNGNTVVVQGLATPGVNAVGSTLFAPGARVGAGFVNPYAQSARLYGFIADIDPDRTQDNKATTTRFAVDLRGSAGGWDVNAAGGITKVKTEIDYSGYVNRNALYAALRSGSWNPLGGNTPELVGQISPHFSNAMVSKLNYVDLVGSRELMQLGAGPLALAAGVHWHKREQNAPPAAPTANGLVASTTAFVIGQETNTAAFAELQATPIKSLELHVSSRYDHYDTYGNSFTPAASFKWTPVQAFALRGTFARGFRAPNPAEVST